MAGSTRGLRFKRVEVDRRGMGYAAAGSMGEGQADETMTERDRELLGHALVYLEHLRAELSDDCSFKNLFRTDCRLLRAGGVRPPLAEAQPSSPAGPESQLQGQAAERPALRSVP
jgi:hypothetical protein